VPICPSGIKIEASVCHLLNVGTSRLVTPAQSRNNFHNRPYIHCCWFIVVSRLLQALKLLFSSQFCRFLSYFRIFAVILQNYGDVLCTLCVSGTRHLPRMLQALTSVARLSFSMTLLSRPSSPLSTLHIPARHPSDGLLPRYRKSSVRGGVVTGLTADSTSTDTDGSSPAPGGGLADAGTAGSAGRCRTDDRSAPHRYDLQLSPPRERSRSDATTYYRRHPASRLGTTDHPDRLIEALLTQRGRSPVRW